MRYAESVQITGKLPSIIEGKPGIELQAIGRERPCAALARRQAVEALRDTCRFCDEYGWI